MQIRIQLATLLMALLPFSVMGATKTWTGKISDSMCGVTHTMVSEHQEKGEISKAASNKAEKERECTLACVKAGGKYVFVSQGKVFEISNQDYAGLEEHAGHTVKLTGDLDSDGKTIKVSEVTMPGKSDSADQQQHQKNENK